MSNRLCLNASAVDYSSRTTVEEEFLSINQPKTLPDGKKVVSVYLEIVSTHNHPSNLVSMIHVSLQTNICVVVK